jgi:hypothetical protein
MSECHAVLGQPQAAGHPQAGQPQVTGQPKATHRCYAGQPQVTGQPVSHSHNSDGDTSQEPQSWQMYGHSKWDKPNVVPNAEMEVDGPDVVPKARSAPPSDMSASSFAKCGTIEYSGVKSETVGYLADQIIFF